MSAQAAAPVIEVSGVTLRFGGVTALEGVSLQVGADELVALIGPNGAGKSSLLNVLSGFYRPQLGSIRYRGEDIGGWPVHRIAVAGMARTFQGTHLLARMSVVDNILVGRYAHMHSNLLQAFAYWGTTQREETAHRAKAEEIMSPWRDDPDHEGWIKETLAI